ncbi:MAG: superoxide dismutase family protein [Burkholderiales bacterium]
MRHALPLLLLTAALSGCAMFRAPVSSAIATLEPASGHSTRGTAYFQQVGERVRVQATVTGLRPGQEHGFHVHEVGDCGDDAAAAKGHFNPYGKPHAHFSARERHAGDLPALKADASGRAHLDEQLEGLAVAAGPAGIVGRALVVHAEPDDYRTQPHGRSGGRIACGVIRAAPQS